MGEGQPEIIYEEVPETVIGAIGDGSGHLPEFIDLSEPSAETLAAYQGTVDRAPGVPSSDDVMLGEYLVRPSTSRSTEDTPDHIDLPIGQDPAPQSDIYNRMVERPGFPPASEEVDLELP